MSEHSETSEGWFLFKIALGFCGLCIAGAAAIVAIIHLTGA